MAHRKRKLSDRARSLISKKIAWMIGERKTAFWKRSHGKSLSEKDKRAMRRSNKQIIAIAFDEARKRGYSVPRR